MLANDENLKNNVINEININIKVTKISMKYSAKNFFNYATLPLSYVTPVYTKKTSHAGKKKEGRKRKKLYKQSLSSPFRDVHYKKLPYSIIQ